MPRDSRQDNTLSCPQCGAENYSFASFCIACGEPFDERLDDETIERRDVEALERWHVLNVAEFERLSVARIKPPVSSLQPLTLRDRLARREAVIGLVLMLLIVGYVVFDWRRSVAQVEAYNEGVVAEQRYDWNRAAVVFERAGDLRDASSKASYARSQLAERNHLYIAAFEAMSRNDWTAATAALEGVEAIQPYYADSASLLRQSRSKAVRLELCGPLPALYRRVCLAQIRE